LKEPHSLHSAFLSTEFRENMGSIFDAYHCAVENSNEIIPGQAGRGNDVNAIQDAKMNYFYDQSINHSRNISEAKSQNQLVIYMSESSVSEYNLNDYWDQFDCPKKGNILLLFILQMANIYDFALN